VTQVAFQGEERFGQVNVTNFGLVDVQLHFMVAKRETL
jgi:hypothetical protein